MHKICNFKPVVYHFRFFEKDRSTAEMPLRFGLELHNYKVYSNLNIPFIIRFVFLLTTRRSIDNKNAYGIEYIRDFKIGKIFRIGFDSYNGEFAILFPLLKLWFQCDYLSNNFRQFSRFSVFVFLLKVKWNELTFRVGLLGFRFCIRIAPD